MSSKKIIITTIIVIAVFTPFAVFADVPANHALDIMLNQFQSSAQGWENQLRVYATRLFWILAGIDISVMAIKMAIQPDDFSGFAANLVRKVLTIGFFYALIDPNSPIYGPHLAQLTVSSFQTAIGSINNTPTTPADIFNAGFNLMVKIFDKLSLWSPTDSLGYIIAGYIIMVVFALISAMVLFITIQMFIVIYAGILLLGFGGSSFTRDIAITYLRAFFATGVKLFIMLLIANIGMNVVNGWITSFNNPTFKQMGLFIGVSIVLLTLIKVIPDMLSNMINGISYGSGGELVHAGKQAAMTAVGATAGAAAGAVGGFMAVKEAAAMAGSQGAKGAVGKTAATAKNLATGAAGHIADRAAKTTPGQIASHIAVKHSLIKPQDTSTRNSENVGSVESDR